METISDGLRTFKLYAEMKKGTSFKFYEVVVQETEKGRAAFVANWGRIGSRGQSKDYGDYGYEHAKLLAAEQFNKKLAKGYKKTAPLQALASACESPEDRLDEEASVEITFPTWDTGNAATDKRLTKLASDTLTKLSLVRADKEKYYSYERGYQTYWKEIIRLVEGFAEGYFRVAKTATHRPFCSEAVEWKANMLFKSFAKTFSLSPVLRVSSHQEEGEIPSWVVIC